MMNARTMAAAMLVLVIAMFGLIGCKSNNNKNNPSPTGQQTVSQPTAEATSPAGTTPGATQPGGSPLAINPCGLITKEEAAAALGEGVADGLALPATSLEAAPGLTVQDSSCTYTSTTTALYIGVDYRSASADRAAEVHQAISDACAGKEAISGLGDVACWYDTNHKELQVSKGAAFLDITIDMAADASQALQTLAQAALGRLS